LHYIADFDKGIFKYVPSEEDDPSGCDELKEEYDGCTATGEDVF
jgi:hypothetical protein